MIKITNKNIIDVVKYSDTIIIFAESVPMGDLAEAKSNFFILDFETGEKEVVTTSVYKMKKYGHAFERICQQISEYVNCSAIILENKNVLVMSEDSEAGLFDRDGELVWTKKLRYNDEPVTSLVNDGEYFWSVCKNEDSVIRFNAENFNTDIRIGGKEQDTFSAPYFASADENYVYVCCSDKVRKISKDDLTVSDVDGIYETPKQFYKLGRFSILCNFDGTYIDKDE
ncbi:MAG: hypothetical protein IJ643_03715 [Eubacterium sp.]|nr:hypothetical protein [Eubacterium sp.]